MTARGQASIGCVWSLTHGALVLHSETQFKNYKSNSFFNRFVPLKHFCILRVGLEIVTRHLVLNEMYSCIVKLTFLSSLDLLRFSLESILFGFLLITSLDNLGSVRDV